MPVVALIGKPVEGVIEKVPPVDPFSVTGTGGFGFVALSVALQRLAGL
jgi:hypothetical protein